MIVHRYHDGSEGHEYQIGDVVKVLRTIHGGWFDYGPTRAERCVVERIEHFNSKSWQTADLYIRYSDEWGTAFCFPWMVEPTPETRAAATVIDVPK